MIGRHSSVSSSRYAVRSSSAVWSSTRSRRYGDVGVLRSAPPPGGMTSPSLPWSSAANSLTSEPSAAKPVTGLSRRGKKSVLVSSALTNVCTESRFRASTRSWSPNGFGSSGPLWTTTTDVGRGAFGLVAMPHSHMQYDQSSVSDVNTRITASAAPSARFSSSFSGLPSRGPSKSGLEDRCTRTLPAVLFLTNRAIVSAISRSECLWLTNTRGSSVGTWLVEFTRQTISPGATTDRFAEGPPDRLPKRARRSSMGGVRGGRRASLIPDRQLAIAIRDKRQSA